jgi:hypothetical protein
MTAQAVSMLRASSLTISNSFQFTKDLDFVPNDSFAVCEARSRVSFSGSHDGSGVRKDLSRAVLFGDQ